MKPDLSLYLITDPALCGDRGILATVEAAVKGGITAVQLRDKHAPAREISQLALALMEILKVQGVPLLINDRLDVALAVGADGVHLGQSDLQVEAARKIAGPNFIIGLSVSQDEEIAEAHSLPPNTVDYLGIGPIFSTSTKKDARVPLGLNTTTKLRRSTQLPCIGIGGINIENAGSAWSTGLNGIAVVSAICAAHDPKSAAEALLSCRS